MVYIRQGKILMVYIRQGKILKRYITAKFQSGRLNYNRSENIAEIK